MSRRIALIGYDDIACVKSLTFFIRSMQIEMGMPIRVRDAIPKVTYEEYESKLDAMADAALLDRCTPTNPRVPTKADIIDILRELW
jgi:alcohol dehydrogenase class IV